jgi:hypothetical protein
MNRVFPQPEGPKFVLVQTPVGLFKFEVPASSGPDPVAVAMDMFQKAIETGVHNPLAETLTQLKQMAIEGSGQPLITGLVILKQMADNGLMPPVPELIRGTGITETDLTQAYEALPKRTGGLFERMGTVYLN